MKKILIFIIILFVLLGFILVIYKYSNDKVIRKKPINTATLKNKNNDNKANKENIMEGITVNFHSSIRMEKDNKIIYFDPYQINDNKNDADYIFITHSHYDHYSEEDIKKVMNDNTKFIVTTDLEDKISLLGVKSDNIMVTYPNESFNIDDFKVETIPAYNINSTYHKKSNNWLGYIIQLSNIRYYIVGDSDVTDEMKKISCDVIFIPVGGTYTMTDEEASKIVNQIKPKYAIPIHYGIVGSDKNAQNFVDALDESIKGIILK